MGVVCIIPAINASTDYNDLFQQLELGSAPTIDTANRRTNSIKYSDPFYADVFEKQGQSNRLAYGIQLYNLEINSIRLLYPIVRIRKWRSHY